MSTRIRFDASETAVEALLLDDPSMGVQWVTGRTYEADVETAIETMKRATWYATDYEGDSAWRYKRPCRAVAKRILAALQAVGLYR